MDHSHTPELDLRLRMSFAAIKDAERALRCQDLSSVGERYGSALVADWRHMHAALVAIVCTRGDEGSDNVWQQIARTALEHSVD